MKKLKLTLLPVLLFVFFAEFSNAQTPIACDGKFYVSHAGSGSYLDSTYIDLITFSHGATLQTAFGNSGNIGLNAIGFNPADGFIYGLRYPFLPSSQPDLIKVDATGTFTDLGAITGAYPAGNLALAGCFDAAGNYYTSNDAGAGNVSGLYKIDVATGVSSLVGSTNLTPQSGGDLFFVDMAVNAANGNLYGITNYCCGEVGTKASALYQIDKTTGNATLINQIIPVGPYFGAFFNDFGQLYGYRNDGNLYQIDLASATATLVGNGVSFSYADACSCNFRVSTLLSATASCGTTSAEVALNVVVKNYSAISQAGLSYNLTLPDVFQFTQSAAAIKAILLPLYGGAVDAVISSANGGVNNQLDITGMNVLVNNSILPSTSFTLNTIVNPAVPTLTYPVAARLSGLPLLLGTNEPSDDPSTLDADDSTVINLPSGCTVVLPVALLNFNVSPQGNTALVNWATTSEINNAYFEIERSQDGKNWNTIGKVSSLGNSSLQRNYNFTDVSPYVGNNYYRLKTVGLNGAYQYSFTRLIKFINIAGLTVYPNPSKAFFQLKLNNNAAVPYEIIDISGKTIRSGSITNTAKIEGLIPGVYIARVHAQDGVKIAKIIVQ